MTDPNNIPQEAQQLKEDLNRPKDEGDEQTKPDIADTDFDKEYDIAQKNETGSGTQSSDPNPVNREGASAGDKSGTTGSGSGKVDNINSPGDSDPDDYMDMAKDVTKSAEDNKS